MTQELIIANPDFAATLTTGASDLGITLSPEQCSQFLRYAALLAAWNKRVNLTRVPEAETIGRHILDSLSGAKAIDFSRKIKVLDLGSGPGFPGLALKIAFPQLSMDLMDGTGKKTMFLQAVIDDLQLTGVRAIHARAEEAARKPEFKGAYHLVTARALAPMDRLASWMLPFMMVGGRGLAYKSAEADAEIADARRSIARIGARIEQVLHIHIPVANVDRRLVVLLKPEPPSSRRTAVPRGRPGPAKPRR